MGRTIKTPPERTVFSINPETGEPFIAMDYANNLALNHARYFARNLHSKFSEEDLRQEILLALTKYAYDPTRSSAKTFFLLVARTIMGKMHQIHYVNSNRHLEIPDYMKMLDSEELGWATEGGAENVTPEDILLANEKVALFMANQATLPAYERKAVPDGFNGLRTVRVMNGKKVSSKKKKVAAKHQV